jgi:hypothetical protein
LTFGPPRHTLAGMQRRPSPSLIISLLALFVSLGGTGYAALTITGKNVKNSSLTGRDVKNSSLTGRDVKSNSLTGGDVIESRLGKVPRAAASDSAARAGSAATADSAGNAGTVGGKRVLQIDRQLGFAAPKQAILSANGLSVSATCSGDLSVSVTTTSPNTSATAVTEKSLTQDTDLDPGESFAVSLSGNGLVALSARAPSGAPLTMNVGFHDADLVPTCGLYGTALA